MMTKTKFLECKRYSDMADNNALNSSDKFAKVRPLFNAINADKSMVPFFGKHGAKQYIHGEPINGFKLWVVATLVSPIRRSGFNSVGV